MLPHLKLTHKVKLERSVEDYSVITDQKCEHCDNIMKTDIEYVDHLVNEHPTLKLPLFVYKQRNIFKCPDCPDQFGHLKAYYKHRGGLAKVNIVERSKDWRSQARKQLDLPALCPQKQ